MKQRLTKSARLAFIASLCAGGMSSALQPSRYDLREECQLVTHNQDKGNLPIDDDLPELPSALQFEKVKQIDHDESVLTAKERKQLAKERAAYRLRTLIAFDLSRPRNPFALALV